MTSEIPGLVIVSPGGLGGRGGIGSVTRAMVCWIGTQGEASKPFVIDPRGSGPSWQWPFYFLIGVFRLAYLTIFFRPKILHLQVSERHSFVRKGLLLFLGRAMGMTVILHHHGAELIPFFRSTGTLMRMWTRWVVRSADLNIVLGLGSKNFICEEIGADRESVSVLYNATQDIGPVVSALRLKHAALHPQPSDFRILVMAHLTPRKGIGELVDALAILRARGVRVRATFAGAGDPQRYIDRATTLCVQDSCYFAGWIDPTRVPELFAAADCLVLPSFEEGLPMSILESLSASVPILSTPVGSISEVLEHKKTALLVPAGDSSALADAVESLSADGNLRKHLSENGRALFESQFNIETYMSVMIRTYREALALSPA